MSAALTPEEIVDVLVGLVNKTGRELIAQKIRSYGDRRSAELAEALVALDAMIFADPQVIERAGEMRTVIREALRKDGSQ